MLIVAYDFAPLNLISSQRINYFANFFHENGFEITVLTSKKREIDGPLTDVTTYENLKKKINLIEIDYLSDSAINLTSTKKRNVLKKIRKLMLSVGSSLIDYRTKWAWDSIKYINNKKDFDTYDVILTSSFPACVNIVGHYIKNKNKSIQWIADFRDLWSGSHLSNYTLFSRAIDKLIEKKLLSNSDLITVVSEGSVNYQKKLHHKDVIVVRNGYIPEEFHNIKESNFFKQHGLDDKVNIVYAGNIYPGRRDPSLLIEYIQEKKLEEKVFISFFGRYIGDLNDIINKYNCSNFVKFQGEYPRQEILSIMKSANINLFLESGEDDAECVIPGKLFELIALKKPILSIGPKVEFESFKLIKESNLLIEFKDILNPSLGEILINENLTREYQCEKILSYILGDKN